MRTFNATQAAEYIELHGANYQKTAVVTATVLTEDTTWTSSNGDEMSATAGDVLVSDGNDSWSIKADIFAATYAEAPGGWVKTVITRLARIDEPFTVATLEGPATGNAGDYLACGGHDDAWPIPAEFVSANYKEVSNA